MSIYNLVSGAENQELRTKMKTMFLRPPFKLKTEIKAPPITENGRIVGTAFDYLLRFYLENLNKGQIVTRGRWVADGSFDRLIPFIKNTRGSHIRAGNAIGRLFKKEDLMTLIITQYEKAKYNYKNFISTGLLNDDLLESTLFLAKLDVFFRRGFIDITIDSHHEGDIKDLNNLMSILDKSKFKSKTKCYLNPTFGEGSEIVEGADADLIIDNTLIDIKVTKHLILERENLNQILGYYVLSLIGGINDNPNDKPIENIGLYFARHGELWTIPVIDLGDAQKFEEFTKWFISYVTRWHWSDEETEAFFKNLKSIKKSNIKK